MMTSLYTQDISGALGPHAVDAAYVAELAAGVAPHMQELTARKQAGDLPMLALVERGDDLPAMRDWVARTRQNFDTLVVLGTGGSSLGGHSFAWFATNPFRDAPVRFVDNTDPDTFAWLAESLNLSRTAFLAISKSGGTVDTMAQLLTARILVRRALGRERDGQFTVITMTDHNPLHDLAVEAGYNVIPHDPKLGGRFSVFSEVGLLPALFAGADIAALRAGAAEALHAAEKNEGGLPATGAALHAAMLEKGKSIAVLMSYSDRLRRLGCWYRQTWAESVGKDGTGSTPAPAVGAVDQHSQLQLYLDGPKDKFFTLILPDHAGHGPVLPAAETTRTPYLSGHTIGDVMEAQARGTHQTLIQKHCPTRIIRTGRLDEKTLGALVMHLTLETVFTAHLLGVNAFDQPAVEQGKQLTREYLVRDK